MVLDQNCVRHEVDRLAMALDTADRLPVPILQGHCCLLADLQECFPIQDT